MNVFKASLSEASIGFPLTMQNLTMFPLEAETSEKEGLSRFYWTSQSRYY